MASAVVSAGFYADGNSGSHCRLFQKLGKNHSDVGSEMGEEKPESVPRGRSSQASLSPRKILNKPRLVCSIYPHPLILQTMQLVNALPVSLQLYHRHGCFHVGYADTGCLVEVPGPFKLLLLRAVSPCTCRYAVVWLTQDEEANLHIMSLLSVT